MQLDFVEEKKNVDGTEWKINCYNWLWALIMFWTITSEDIKSRQCHTL